MNVKKGLAIILVILFAICVISSAHATSNGTITNIGGIDFNIPSGFEKSNSSMENNTTIVNGIEVVCNIWGYYGSGGIFTIRVVDYNDEIPDSVIEHGDKTTINGIGGYLEKKDDDKYAFHYKHNDTSITVTAQYKELIEKILIK